MTSATQSAVAVFFGMLGFICAIVGVWLEQPVKSEAKKIMPEAMRGDEIEVRRNYSSYVWDIRVPVSIKKRHVDARLWWGVALIWLSIAAYVAKQPVAVAVSIALGIGSLSAYFYWKTTKLRIRR